VNVIKRVHIG